MPMNNEQTTYSILPHNVFNRMVQATLEDVEFLLKRGKVQEGLDKITILKSLSAARAKVDFLP